MKSAKNRLSLSVSSSLYAISDIDKPVCGFLNRKAVTDSSGKKSKDRQWQTLWCQLKETKIEFYKVSGINLKPNGDPPPRDIYPPPNRQQSKSGFLELNNVVLEIDLTSQKDKDLDKRRKYLFRLVLNGKIEYLFQAPSENQMMQWVTSIKRTMFSEEIDESETGDLQKPDVRIKMSRCSINKKSKHNTNSVRVVGIQSVDSDDVDGPGSILMELDPRLSLLKKRLQEKRELVKQIQKMLSSFSGNIECLYKETESTSSSIPSSSSADNVDGLKHSGSDTFSNDGSNARTVTTLLNDYYLLPGAEWSLIKKGDHVDVLGRLPNGWYRCRALKDVTYEFDNIPSTPEGMNAVDNEQVEDQDRNTISQDMSSEWATSLDNKTTTSSFDDKESEDYPYDMGDTPSPPRSAPPHSSPRLRTESYLQATTNDITRPKSFMRKDSYKMATGGIDSRGFVDSITVHKTRHLSLGMHHSDFEAMTTDNYLINQIRVKSLINSERENCKYDIPLIGAIPPSMLQHFASLSVGARPSSLTSDYGSSAPVTEENPVVAREGFDNFSMDSMSLESQSLETSASVGIDIPKHHELEDEGVVGSVMGSMPSKGFPAVPNSLNVSRHKRAASLPSPSLEQLDEENMLKTNERTSISQVPSPEPSLEENIIEQESEYVQEQESGYVQEQDSSQYTSKREQNKSREQATIILSPTSSLERKQGSFSVEQMKSAAKVARSKSELQKSGLLRRIRTNILGNKKRSGKAESGRLSPLATTFSPSLEDLGEMRSRVTSISGKAIRAKGMAVKFGDSSSESESEDLDDKHNDATTSPIPVQPRKTSIPEIVLPSPSPSPSHDFPHLHHGMLTKTASSPVASRKHVPDPSEHFEIKRLRTESQSFTCKNLADRSKYLGYIQAPPKRVQRYIYLDPTQNKHGFNLVPYELSNDQGKVPRAIVQYVLPGSSAFVAGLYPGDQILKVNQKDYSRSPVSEIVNAIQNADTARTLELVVAFVDGVKRFDLQAKGEECRVQLQNKQNQLTNIITSEARHLWNRPPSCSPPPPMSPTDESPWFRESLSDEENSLHIFPYDRKFNKIIAISYDDVTKLSCDMLVMPLRSESKSLGGDEIHRVLKFGGDALMDELSLEEQVGLGENIITGGHRLSFQAICHSVFGNSDEDIISCCQSAMETAYEQNYKSIVFWVEGFSLACVSPNVIISTVRSWLEERDNRYAFEKIVFSIPSTPAIMNVIERYFPLEDYERNERIEALSYCTDSEDNDEEEYPKYNVKRASNDLEKPPLVPPKIPPKPKPKPKLKMIDSKSMMAQNLSELDNIMNELNSVVASFPENT